MNKNAPDRTALTTIRDVVFLTLVVGFATSIASAEEANDDHRDIWTKYYASQIPKYKVTAGENQSLLTADPTAKLRWGNPIRTGTHGDVFVWTLNGRLQLVGNFFSYKRGDDLRQVSHEFHSMSTEPIVVNREGSPALTIAGPGLKFELIPDARAPTAKRVSRLSQMRALAKDFSASVKDGNDKSPLRALPQPLFRYETKNADEDGALFAYVMGTDPELFVSIEARQTDAGPKWHFAAARFSHAPLELQYKEQVVWEFGADNDSGYAIEYIDRQPFTPKLEPEPQVEN